MLQFSKLFKYFILQSYILKSLFQLFLFKYHFRPSSQYQNIVLIIVKLIFCKEYVTISSNHIYIIEIFVLATYWLYDKILGGKTID